MSSIILKFFTCLPGPCGRVAINFINIEDLKAVSSLHFILKACGCSEKILNIIDDILDDNVSFKKQDDQNVTYANKIDKSEGRINWNEEAEKIIGKINGLYPSPGAWFSFNGERHKILKATLHGSNGNPGYVLSESLEVACGKNSLKIIEIQREGKKAQKINEFIQGTKIKTGSNLNNA